MTYISLVMGYVAAFSAGVIATCLTGLYLWWRDQIEHRPRRRRRHRAV